MATLMSQVTKKIRTSVARHGWHCISVPGEEEGQFDFSYSIGFEETLKHPEVSIIGLPSKIASPIIANCYDLVRKGHPLEVGKDYPGLLSDGYNVMVVGFAKPSHHGDYFGAGMEYHGREVRMLVLLWPNRSGVFPVGTEGHPQREAMWVMSD
ncbi:MAG: DUF4262 domain-containing protein [Pseudomonadota bacterium]